MSDGIEQGGFSLADIAGLNTDDVEELRSSALPAGMYIFECGAGKMEDKTFEIDGQDERRITVAVPLKVIEVKAIAEKDITEADVMGKVHTETFFISPAEAAKGIGYIKGWVADIGASNTGNMGGVEGAPPGYLDALEGHRFEAKAYKKKDKKGEWRTRIELLRKKKAAA